MTIYDYMLWSFPPCECMPVMYSNEAIESSIATASKQLGYNTSMSRGGGDII